MEQIIVTTPSELRALIAEECERLYSRLAERDSGNKVEEPEMLNARQAAAYLTDRGYQISKSTIYSLVSAGEIPFSKFGGKALFSRSELEDWAEKRSRKPYTSRQNQARTLSNPRKRA